jgi:methyl-accepting chemotaxis protein
MKTPGKKQETMSTKPHNTEARAEREQAQMGDSMKAQSKFQKISDSAKALTGSVKIGQMTNPFRSVGMKLFAIIFCSIIACVLTVGLMAYAKSKSIIETKVSDATAQTVSQVASNLDIIFRTYEDLSLQILIDKKFHELTRTIANGADDYSKFEASRSLSDKLQSYIMSNNTISGMYLLPLDEKMSAVTAGSASTDVVTAMLESDWLKAAVEAGGKVNWISQQEEGFKDAKLPPVVGLTRVLKDSTTNEAKFVLLIAVQLDSLTSRYREVALGADSEISILDENGNFIATPNNELVGKASNLKLAEEGKEELSGSVKVKTPNGREVLAVYQTFESMDWKLVGTLPVKELVRDAKAIQTLTWVTVLIAGLIAVAIGGLVIVTIARPLVSLRDLMNDGAGGNLTVRSTIKKRQDEIGELSESFNRMMTQIKELAVQTTRSAEDVLLTANDLTEASRKTALSAREIAVATEEIAGGATSLAMEAERGSDLTANIDVQMKNVIDANDQMVISAGEVEKASEQGTAYMGVLIEKTGMTEQMTRSMVEKVDALKESTGSIVKILDVLNNLTKQTNILSLNATIEAARAGAAGKGFMVVADEIRKLADQSRQSIDIVGQITEKIRGEIDETVDVLSDAYPLFQEQIGSVKEANQIFLSVQGQMGQFAEKLDQVTGSISQLNESQTVLAEAMTNVSAVAEQSSATSEEVASLSSEQLSISDGMVGLSEKLDAVSRGLKQSLSQFKID